MSKRTETLDLDKEYEFKNPKSGANPKTLRAALKWLEDHSPEDEETGEGGVPDTEWVIIYGIRRMIALHKDERRYEKGLLAERRYAPRVDNVEHKPRKLAGLVEEVHGTQEHKPVAKIAKPPRVRKPKPVKAAPAPTPNPAVAEVL